MSGDFKRFFMRGLAALAPTLVTIALLLWAYQFIDQNIGQHITRSVLTLYAWGGEPHPALGIDREAALKYGEPIDLWDPDTGQRLTSHYMTIMNAEASQEAANNPELQAAKRAAMWDLVRRKWRIFNFIGFVIAILLIYVMGYFLASFIGRATWLLVERTLQRVPLIGAIYPNIKQVTDFFISDKKLGFSGVVAVQYPRHGIWSIGLVTGPPMRAVGKKDKRDLITVFIPSSPTPVTGYTITVSREDVLELDLTLDEALRYTISAGVVKPSTMRSGDRSLPEETAPPAATDA
jgi:uncharacterized membrane protein